MADESARICPECRQPATIRPLFSESGLITAWVEISCGCGMRVRHVSDQDKSGWSIVTTFRARVGRRYVAEPPVLQER